MESQLVAAWRMGNEANLFLLESLDKDQLKASYSPRTRPQRGENTLCTRVTALGTHIPGRRQASEGQREHERCDNRGAP